MAQKKYGESSQEALFEYKLGDMNTSMIRTEKGKTILLQHNISNPHPYTRIHLLNGTKGYVQKYPLEQIVLYPDFTRGDWNKLQNLEFAE